MHQPLLQKATKSTEAKFFLTCLPYLSRILCRQSSATGGEQGVTQQVATCSYHNYVSSSSNLVHFSSIKLILKMWVCACFFTVRAVIQKM